MVFLSTILFVDDSDDLRRPYCDYLQALGFTVVEACDGLEALHLATSQRPSLIVMDLSMPRVDGFEATHRIKSDPRTRFIPIVAFTALTDDEAHSRALSVGCCTVLVKPCDLDELVSVIHRHIANAPRSVRPSVT